jgi:glutathione S-transferase
MPRPVQVAEWLAYRRTELSPLMDEKLAKINDWLQTRTYLAGNVLTLADLVIYAALQPAAVSALAPCSRCPFFLLSCLCRAVFT